MANAAVTADAAGQRSLDESLWWDSFVSLLGDLEKAPLSPDLDDPSLILLEYHLERQCLLKCIREILMLASRINGLVEKDARYSN
ncbi:hypothetical protein QJS04_geneDACA001140 [Acorus gramineus]|uniref:Uncharacterized protein n=1 Tax=Acorus gramineus TaxID=55184 RepID=A0AAV9ACF3_ACOGR|nr:hypothetical protein QJS04_geneDACA001140 [Acorus gramineus]